MEAGDGLIRFNLRFYRIFCIMGKTLFDRFAGIQLTLMAGISVCKNTLFSHKKQYLRISGKDLIVSMSMEKSMEKTKKRELLFLLLLFLLCGVLFALRHFTASPKNSIRITVDGKEQGIYDLSCDQVIQIGGTNVCEIRDGQVRMTKADCPDQLCIKQGAFGANGGMIVCLPNRIVIEPAESTSADAVS